MASRLRRLATAVLLRHSSSPPAGALLHGGQVHARAGRGSPAAAAAVAGEIRQLAADGLLSTGIQVAARVRGEPLVSVWGGCCAATGRAVEESSLMMPWSVAKGVASTALLLVADVEGLSFEAKVGEVWPEFARHGKDSITIAEAAGYRGGMPEHLPLPRQAAHALIGGWRGHWQSGIRWIENYEPKGYGEVATYHPMSFSWIIGGIVERADAQRRHISDVVAQEIAAPLGCEREMFLGRLPRKERSRLVLQCPQVPASLDLDEGERFQSATDASLMTAVANNRLWSSVCLPSSNGFFSAGALAAMYSIFTNKGAVDGTKVLSPLAVEAMVLRMRHSQLFPATTSRYAVKGASGYRDSLGFHPYGHEEPELYGENCASIIGCAGAGGSVAFADPVSGLSGTQPWVRMCRRHVAVLWMLQQLVMEVKAGAPQPHCDMHTASSPSTAEHTCACVCVHACCSCGGLAHLDAARRHVASRYTQERLPRVAPRACGGRAHSPTFARFCLTAPSVPVSDWAAPFRCLLFLFERYVLTFNVREVATPNCQSRGSGGGKGGRGGGGGGGRGGGGGGGDGGGGWLFLKKNCNRIAITV